MQPASRYTPGISCCTRGNQLAWPRQSYSLRQPRRMQPAYARIMDMPINPGTVAELASDSSHHRRTVFLDYNRIALQAEAIAPVVRRRGYHALIAILRGGAFVATKLAFHTGLPLHFMRYQRPNALPVWHSPQPVGPKVLLCEDFAGSGRTLLDCKQFLLDQRLEVDTLVVCKDARSASHPDLFLFEHQEPGGRFVLPWERVRLNPASHAQLCAEAQPDHLYEKTAWDMDGIFLDDIEPHHYDRDLPATLALRDEMPLSPLAPVPAPGDVIVTGRPTEDGERTLAWLRRYQIAVDVHLRSDKIARPSKQQVALWKGGTALRLGCTRYIESCGEQALLLSAAFPELSVLWWNRGEPVAVNGTRYHF